MRREAAHVTCHVIGEVVSVARVLVVEGVVINLRLIPFGADGANGCGCHAELALGGDGGVRVPGGWTSHVSS